LTFPFTHARKHCFKKTQNTSQVLALLFGGGGGGGRAVFVFRSLAFSPAKKTNRQTTEKQPSL